MATDPLDSRIRQQAFDWLAEQVEVHGDVLPRQLLARGFECEGRRIHLLGPQGIFKPKDLGLPLSITTAPSGPYEDSFSGGLLHYKYRGTDPAHPDNEGLRQAMVERVPLVYFHGIVKGRYVAAWPVFIVHADPAGLTFHVAVDHADTLDLGTADRVSDPASEEGRRLWVTREFRQRLRQQGFRQLVLRAYRGQCTLCRLRHEELLDAAHITPYGGGGEEEVSNGLALCKLHHAAFDRHFVGIRADYRVEVRPDIRGESDGPMLRHGLQGLHGQRIQLPRPSEQWPDRERLALRYKRFREAG